MKRSLFLVLILRAIFTFATEELEENSLSNELTPVNCSSTQLGAICDCDYVSLRLSCRNVTFPDSVPLALEHLFTRTHHHYWSDLSVNCAQEIPSAYQMTNQWFSGKVRFASVTLVGNCSRYNDESYHPGGEILDDTEIRSLSIRENTLFFNWNDGFMGFSILFRPIQGLYSLSELTVSRSLFKDNTIKRQFSEICSNLDSCSKYPHPLVKLTIRFCNVSLIESGAFRHLADLELIDLSHNQLSRLSRSAFSPTLTKLRILKLEHNQLSNLEAGFFDGLPQLREINLSFNRMITLPPFTLNSKLIQVVRLGENAWLCRCPMTWILGQSGFADSLVDKPICALPDYVRDKPLIEGLAVVNSTFC